MCKKKVSVIKVEFSFSSETSFNSHKANAGSRKKRFKEGNCLCQNTVLQLMCNIVNYCEVSQVTSSGYRAAANLRCVRYEQHAQNS